VSARRGGGRLPRRFPVAVVGCGTIGQGIAEVLATAGHRVWACDEDAHAQDVAADRVRRSMARLVSRGTLTEDHARTALGNLRWTTDLRRAVRSVRLLVESVPEDLRVKANVLRAADRLLPPTAVIATNTSQFAIGRLARFTHRPDRLIGTHWFPPPQLVRVVELVPGPGTSPSTLRWTMRFLRNAGREPVVVADGPGFVTSRIILALLAEGMRVVDEGQADPAVADLLMTRAFSLPRGPLAMADFAGLDTILDALKGLEAELGKRFSPPEILRRLVREGRLGVKSGHGFHRYAHARRPDSPNAGQ
jgi:3-hydroxybutyryl-CoA dehydrogenase